MQQHIYYTKYALQFADMQIPELVTIFNAQVQNRGWSSMRAYHDQALIDEFQRRGIGRLRWQGHQIRPFCSIRPTQQQIGSNQLIYIRDSAFAVCSCIGRVY